MSCAPAIAAPLDRLVFALDVSDLASARRWIARLAGEVGVFKVGLELFAAAGPDAVRAVHDAGAQCFLDLKAHDIPATVAGVVRAACALSVRYLTVHASSGARALGQAADAARGSDTRLLAVTLLTSLDAGDLEPLGMVGPPRAAVRRLASVALGAGIGGLVCSAGECAMLRRTLGPASLLVVPGIRPAGAEAGDQRRTATPSAAITDGADLLVVGRPIRDARDPVQAARALVAEIAAAAP